MAVVPPVEHQNWSLAIVPTPQPGEALSGYLRRLASANHLYSIHELASIAGLTGFAPRPLDEQWGRLAKVTGVDEAVFAHLRLPHHMAKHAELFDLDGLHVRTNQLSISRLKACPTCVREERPILSEWQLHLVTACGIHAVRLVDACTACERRIGYLDPTYLWRCPNCGTGLADLPSMPASPEEILFRKWVMAGAADAPSDFAELALVTRLSIVERLGNLKIAAEDDGPSDRITTYPHGRVDQIEPARTVEASRRVVAAGMHILEEWPSRYHSILAGLLDLHPSADKEPILRRFGSKAGFTAMKPLCDLSGRPIDFVERTRLAFITEHAGYARAARPERRSSSLFADLDDFAVAATLPESEYVNLSAAARLLGGRQPSFLKPWVKAGLLDIHRRSDGTHAVPRGAVQQLLDRLKLFPSDVGESSYAEILQLPHQNGRSYSPSDFYLDLFAGHILTVVRDPAKAGLAGLAVHVGDLARRQATAWLAEQVATDGFPEDRQLRDAVVAIWGEGAGLNAGDVSSLSAAGQVRLTRVGKRWNASARDVVMHLQAGEGLRPLFLMPSTPDDGLAKTTWRERVCDAPVTAAVETLTVEAAASPSAV